MVRDAAMRQLDWDPEVDNTAIVATLTGAVGSWLQREAAERAAANAPGITTVDNRIVVEPPIRSYEVDEMV
jgi:hypothetical protein